MFETILLDHGSGGTLTQQLIQNLFVRHFGNDTLNALTDAALLAMPVGKPAFTTDSYVVKPLVFPGGNIGKLAVCGTVNDLAVSGARPLYLSAGFILEEGLPYETLELIVETMAREAAQAQVQIVTGDTKVVEKGACDQVFINTAGVGIVEESCAHVGTGSQIRAGDKILINGTIADHGMAVLGKRNELDFSTDIVSDCASLHELIATALTASNAAGSGSGIHFMRDATRGGLATVLCELAQQHQIGIELDEAVIPVHQAVQGLCELLGFDPLYVANEGKAVLVVDSDAADAVLDALRRHPLGVRSAIIGTIADIHPGRVVLHTSVGGKRLVDMLSGAQLPRIC